MQKKQNLHLLTQCGAIVCDFDGTLYLEDEPFSASRSFLEKIIRSQRQLFYFTNNTSKSRKSYLDKLTRMGFPADEERLITAADCTYHYLKQTGLFPDIYLVGNSDLRRDFIDHGFTCLNEQEIKLGRLPAALVLGFDTELTYEKIRTAYELIQAQIPYIATHADFLCPMAHGAFIPDVGSFIEMFKAATHQEPLVMGKPTHHAVEAICQRAQLPAERIAFIGDRLYTDIRMAMNFNMVGVLVLSGETDEEMLANSADQPKILVDGIADLLEAL